MNAHELIERVRELLEPYAREKKYDSQDMTEIGSYLLKKEGIRHTTYFDENEVCYWIFIDHYDVQVSFELGKLSIQIGGELKNGKPKKVLANSVQFEVVTGEQP